MIVYHASYTVIVKPDINHSRVNTDFSKGFYLTTLKQQATLWANRMLFKYNTSFINEYEFNENMLNKYKVLKFDSYNKKWLDFVMKCRKGIDKSNYDIVIGPVADDKVYDTINLYLEKLIDEKETLKRLKSKKINNQICIRNQDTLNSLITFVRGEKYNGK